MVNNKCIHLLRINNKSFIAKEKIFFSPSNDEWQSSIYSFNKNIIFYTINIDKLLYSTINSYFSSIPFKFLNKKIKNTWENLNKVIISVPEVKHTINNVNINIYSYNKQKSYILKIINKIFLSDKKNNIKTLFSVYKNKSYIIKLINKNLNIKNKINGIHFNKNLNINQILFVKNLFIKNIPYLNKNKFIIINTTLKLIFKNKLRKINIKKYYICLLYVNYLKHKIYNMLSLIYVLNTFYNKKINFNIINLKYLYLENSIIANAVVRKLNDRKKRVLKVIKKVLNSIKWPELNEVFKLKVSKKLLDYYSDYKNNLFKSNINSYIETFKLIKINYLLDNNDLLDNSSDNKNNIFKHNINSHKEAFKDINNKFLIGLDFQGSGRLTRRLTASRSIIKRSYKGTSKNMYSSYLGLSTTMLKGYMKSNVQYLNINSHNRNGSFGLKSWLTSL